MSEVEPMHDSYPDDWLCLPVKDVALVKGGKRLPAGEEFSNEITAFPYIRVSDMSNATIDERNIVYVKPEIEPGIRNYKISKDDLYVSIAGTLGLFGRIPDSLDQAQLTENAAKLSSIDKQKYDLNLLTYILNSELTKKQINREIGAGAGVPKLALHRIEGLKVNLPENFEQQQKIAKILSTVDNLIEKTQTLIEKYTAIKQGMMADLFTRGIDMTTGDTSNSKGGKLRPSVEEAPELYKQTELGWVPKEWEIRSIEDVSLGGFKNGYFKDPKLVGSGMKLINVSELYQDYGIDITTEKVERIKVSRKDYEKYKVEIGDIFFTRSSLVLEGIAKSNIVRVLPEEAVFECHVMRLKPDQSQVAPEFLAIYTGMSAARSYLMSMAKQVTMTTIAQPDMVGLPIPIPTLDEQEKVIQQLNAIEELIVKENAEMKKNKAIKKGLMQDLLTGKVKVV